jgi:HK97 family phage prohead protease
MATPEKYSHIKFVPPSGVRREAEYGLKLRREHGRGGTAVGIARARDLSNGTELSPSTVRRMKAYFDRHTVDQKGEGFNRGDKGWPSNGYIAAKLWGGFQSGYSWAKKVVEQMNAADEKSRSYSPETETRSLEVKETGMQNVERRYLAASGSENSTEGALGVEHRADPQTGEKRTYLIGYAAKFNTDSLLLGDFVERIAPSAFEIVENGEDLEGKPLETRGLFNHDPNHLIGRFPNTMKLTVDKIGLKYEIMLPESRKDLAESVARGDLKGSSFSFVVAEGGEKWTREGGKSRRLVTKIKSLLDCGPVTYPAYRDSSVAVAKRSYEQFAAKPQAPKVDLSAEMRKCQEFIGERRGFCPTGPGGGIDNSCGGKSGASKKPADDVGADIHADSLPAIAGAAAGAAVGAIAGAPGAVVGGFAGLVAGAVSVDRYVAKVEKALKSVGSSIKKIDTFARTIGKAMSITSTKTGGVQAEGGGVKMTIEKYAKDEVGKSLAGKVAFIENATNAIGGEGTESVGRLAGTLVKAGRDLGVDHVMVALDTMDRLHEEAFVEAGFTHSITGDDATRITMIKSYKRSSKRYDELMAFYSERRGFCPTGPGGGVDNTCGGGKEGGFGSGNDVGKNKPEPDKPSGGTVKSEKPPGEPKYMEWKKGKDHKSKSKTDKAQGFLDKAREEQLSKGGKDKGKADEGGGVQTWSKGDHFPWTTKQVGDKDGYLQGVHPDGSKTEQYPFKDGNTSEAEKMLGEELKRRPGKRAYDPRQVVEDTLRFLKDRR